MPRLLTRDGPSLKGLVNPGDVLMIASERIDKRTKKPFTWRYLGVAKKIGHKAIVGFQLGAENDRMFTFMITRDDDKVQLLTEDEWPNGARAFRTVLILEGKLDLH